MADAVEMTGSFSDALIGGEYFFLQGVTDGPVYFEAGVRGGIVNRDTDGRLVDNVGVAHYRMGIGYLTVYAGLAGAGAIGQGNGGAVKQVIRGIQMNGNLEMSDYERFKYPGTMYVPGTNPDADQDAALKAGDYSVWSEWRKVQ